ncbi:acetyl-CoA carboxylase biotin carboxyl carrier protein [Engelhardtia mirabilis]|uniref:Biotin carboxyl carrier protein of acetyl-CoA carboxylase n=1 Tax=Engelhardtia mirabilis TaxID=2528011 RepID=A0A518BKA6_9BACT|nr:Acetyl-CoA biotin carboxyl carrier [Planctomycetes bacterium Pla133]QDV01736.1 Acetyl-CoA biotin carboxyl carrier [Planctomycetes bacterium Pla86]
MEIKLITQLARIMSRAELTELEVEDEKEGIKVHLKRGGSDRGASNPIVNVTHGGGPLGGPQMGGAHYGGGGDGGYGQAGGYGQGGPAPGGSGDQRTLPPGTIEFKSPMVGTFYRSSSPDAEPFVEKGSKVDDESVLCIIEAMKVMNEIKAELSGTVVEVLVENAEPVEFGQPLFLIQRGS